MISMTRRETPPGVPSKEESSGAGDSTSNVALDTLLPNAQGVSPIARAHP